MLLRAYDLLPCAARALCRVGTLLGLPQLAWRLVEMGTAAGDRDVLQLYRLAIAARALYSGRGLLATDDDEDIFEEGTAASASSEAAEDALVAYMHRAGAWS